MRLNIRFASVVRFAAATVVFCLAAPEYSHAADLELRSLGVRAQFGEKSRVIGEAQPESFHEYDIAAGFQLPWERQFQSGWSARARLLTHAGVLRGENKTALVVSVIPALAFGRQDGPFVVEAGAGLALLSRHRFDLQDFGGPFQFALTLGVGVPLNRQVEVGYRFLHYSDAGAYGAGTIGTDSHMIELLYLF